MFTPFKAMPLPAFCVRSNGRFLVLCVFAGPVQCGKRVVKLDDPIVCAFEGSAGLERGQAHAPRAAVPFR